MRQQLLVTQSRPASNLLLRVDSTPWVSPFMRAKSPLMAAARPQTGRPKQSVFVPIEEAQRYLDAINSNQAIESNRNLSDSATFYHYRNNSVGGPDSQVMPISKPLQE